MTITQNELLSAIVTVIALVTYFYMGIQVGRMRTKHSIAAPAMTGNPEFERAVRVHMNTLEQIVVFLPLLFIASVLFTLVLYLVPVVGAIWVIGRLMYMQGYMAAPDKRGAGFGVSALANLALLIMSLVGIVQAWLAVTTS